MTSNTGGGRSGIDANSVLASIHTFDPAAGVYTFLVPSLHLTYTTSRL